MSFNRLAYDSCAYAKTLQQSTDPLEYNLYRGKYESCKTCPIGDFPNIIEFGAKADVESDLKGQTRVGSRCPSNKFPKHSQNGVPVTNALTCQNIYYITPNNLPKITNSGLKNINHYNNDMCELR
jgi:hypothetical protein